MSNKPSRPKKQPTGDYESGYARPPKATQFKPGHKGKGGRPRRQTGSSALDAALDRKVTLNEKGKQRKVDVEEAIALGILQDAIKGDPAARRAALQIIEMRNKRNPAMSKEEREKRRLLEPSYQQFLRTVRDLHAFRSTLAWYIIGYVRNGKFHLHPWVLRAAMEREEWRKVHGAPHGVPDDPEDLESDP